MYRPNLLALASLVLATRAFIPPLMLGTQAIYGPNWRYYNFTQHDALTEQRLGIVQMGSNQLKIRLEAHTTCVGYKLDCGEIKSLKQLSQVKPVANAFADPNISWYQFWMYSVANPNPLDRDWTEEMVRAEYNETKEWAVHMLETYSGSGKAFMAGNWEGDWMLMGASGCRGKDGKFNMTCDPTPEVIRRMVQWAQIRQQAIQDARHEVNAANVTVCEPLQLLA